MKKLKLSIVASSLLLLAACAKPNQNASSIENSSFDSGIIDGTTVEASDSVNKTTVGLLIMSRRGQATCTGSLVAPNVVLTAAHCFMSAGQAAVVFGPDMKAAVAAKKYAVITTVYIHPDYNPGPGKDSNDLALAHFDGTLPADYEPANLLPSIDLLKKDMDVVLAGFGASKEVDGKLSGSSILRKATVKLSNPTYSAKEILFATNGGPGACHGDSGGPAFITVENKTYLIGVTSRTTDQKGGCHQDAIYANIATYKTLIEKVAKELQEAKEAE